ncbi:transposable element Tcb1 transposase [Trichonephila clavipes]|nr:transposable element Tcb1 transposase [Trichonephila clavipes]
MSRRKQRSASDQESEFDRGRIAAYRDCGLSFREIVSRVGRNETTIVRICDHWMQESTTDRRDRSYPPQCTTSREDRQIVRSAVTDHSITSRTIAQHIETVTHHSVPARTIRRRLQQSGLSARHPFLGQHLTQNHRRLHRQWCDDNARPHVAHIVERYFVNHQIELLPWPALSPDLSSIENMWSMVAQRLAQTRSGDTRSSLVTCGSFLVLLYPENTSKVFLNQYRGVWQW